MRDRLIRRDKAPALSYFRTVYSLCCIALTPIAAPYLSFPNIVTNKKEWLAFAVPPDELYVLSVPCKDAAVFQIAAFSGNWRDFWRHVDDFRLTDPVCPNADLFWDFWSYLLDLGARHHSWTYAWWPP